MRSLTVVTPCFNEEENVERCVKETLQGLEGLKPGVEFEHVFIDNHSSDKTLEVLAELRVKFPHIRILANTQNVGVFSSIQRGMHAATGEWIVPFLAADCQDPPKLIAEMLSIQEKTNCDSVFAIRHTRAEGILLLSLRRMFYYFLKKMTKSSFKPGVSEFCLIRKSAAKKIIQIEDPNPFLRIYLNQLPGKVEYLPFHMLARTNGTSSANFFSLTDDALNAFSLVLPSIFSRLLLISCMAGALGVVISIYGFINNFILGNSDTPLISIGVLVSILSILFGTNAVIGHYVYIIHGQIRQKLKVETLEL